MKKALFSLIFIFTGIFSYSMEKSELINEGIYQIQMGNYWRGKEYLEDYLTLEEDIEAYLYLIEADKKLGNLNRADSVASTASKKYPEDTRPLYERVLIRKLMADNEKTGWKKINIIKNIMRCLKSTWPKQNIQTATKYSSLGVYTLKIIYMKRPIIFL